MISKSSRTSRYFTYIEPVLKIPIIKTYGFAIFTIISLIVFIIFAIKPTVETILVLQKELEVEKDTLDKINQKSKNLSLGRENYQKIPSNIKTQISSALPRNVEMTTVIGSLEGAALNAQASISALQFQPLTIEKGDPTKEIQSTEINFTYNMEGSYDSLKAVLDSLKNSARLFSLDNITFNKTDSSSSILMSVTGKAYYLK